eukprot:TRINITY_DN6454_c0_g1_i1.p1 TRINITY_DN6454_c0_g1~~TRINITY_DN6454_c0_g1_i1.p1  ORF type:complete len:412 (-),score=92.75 TRINITY_DN6454_c0_g1_i1:105-1283(-)
MSVNARSIGNDDVSESDSSMNNAASSVTEGPSRATALAAAESAARAALAADAASVVQSLVFLQQQHGRRDAYDTEAAARALLEELFAHPGAEWVEHPLRSCDTLAGLAIAYGCSATTIKRINRIYGEDLDLLPPHTVLRIPKGAAASGVPPPDESHTPAQHQARAVRALRILCAMDVEEARYYLDTNEWDVQKAYEAYEEDREWEESQRKEPQKICASNEPQKTESTTVSTPPNPRTAPLPQPALAWEEHVLRAGDTLEQLAIAHGCTAAAIKKANGLYGEDLDLLPPRTVLRVPKGPGAGVPLPKENLTPEQLQARAIRVLRLLDTDMETAEARYYLETNDWDVSAAHQACQNDRLWEQANPGPVRKFGMVQKETEDTASGIMRAVASVCS